MTGPAPATFKVASLALDIGPFCTDPTTMTGEVRRRIDQAIERDAEMVVLPELFWMGLASHFDDEATNFSSTASCVWEEIVPSLGEAYQAAGVPLILGSCPQTTDMGTVNRCPILLPGEHLHHDKLALTPWESGFMPGRLPGRLIEWCGLRIAVLICFDIEMPEIAAWLKREAPDLVVVPAATETRQGVSRLRRCASARAVELGAAVVTSHLRGFAPVEMVSENQGGVGFYLPAQSLLAEIEQEYTSLNLESGDTMEVFEVPFAALRLQRTLVEETNPARLLARI